VSEAQKLTEKLAGLAKGANWLFHLLSHLYLSIAYALSKNKRFLTESSAEFHNIILAIRTGAFVTPCNDLARHTFFAIKHGAKLTYHASFQYNINQPCVTKPNSFATSSSLIQVTNGKHLLPI
jgi:hypothetical protein